MGGQMRSSGEVELKKQLASKRISLACECDPKEFGEFTARETGSIELARCPCWEKHRQELRAFEACIPKKFWRSRPSDVIHNRHIFDDVILHYLEDPQLRTALKEGAGIFLGGPNGSGKTMFLSYILMELIRKTRASVYYTTTMQLDKDLKRGFRDDEWTDRLESCLTRHFLVIDEVGKESFKAGDNFNRKTFEYWLRAREEKNLPTLIASNLSLEILRQDPEKGGYGETIGSLIDGTMVTVLMDEGDIRKKKGATLRKKMGWR